MSQCDQQVSYADASAEWCLAFRPYADWRVAILERAATRPCRRLSDDFALFGLACWQMLPCSDRCQSTPPVAR